MDNRINEIRRKISALRLEMADAEARMHAEIAFDRDCSESALCLLALRGDMKRLIGEWRAAGGTHLLPTLRERAGLRAGTTRHGKPACIRR